MPVYGIDLTAGAAVGVVGSINGVPFVHRAGGEAFAASLPLQLDVVNGANQVSVVATTRLGGPDGPSTPVAVDKQLFLTAQVNAGEVTGPSRAVTVQPVTKAEWRPEKQGAAQATLPHTLTLAFNASGVTGEPIWRRASDVSDASFDAEAMQVARAVLDLLKAQNLDGYAELVRRKYEEAARAFPQGGDVARHRWIDIEELRDLVTQPHIAWADPATLGPRFVRHANGRMIECLARDGQALIRGHAAGAEEPILIGLMLARLDGRLVPVR